MKWITNFLLFLLLVLLVLTAALLLIDNPTPIELHFLNLSTPAIPIFWWLLIALVCGIGVGFAIAFGGFVRGKFAERQLRRELNLNKEELHRIRTLSLHD